MEEIARKLKAYRLANRMTLKQLANEAGCTDAYLSQLERGLANPSITILKKVASALRMKVVDFFVEPEIAENDVVMREQERVNINFKEGEAKIQMLVRNIRDKRMQPFYTTIEPGGGSKGSYSHIGEEFGIVLQGELEINLNGASYRLRKNESFYFSSQTPHSWGNPCKRRTVVIWVVSPPTW
ncbi:MAG TPA: cupin domain-containing protein [Thermodesulfobacteriota bacterium]|nr:cupin domain-containing protein [Thermodesulfobacteriota bacterium]